MGAESKRLRATPLGASLRRQGEGCSNEGALCTAPLLIVAQGCQTALRFVARGWPQRAPENLPENLLGNLPENLLEKIGREARLTSLTRSSSRVLAKLVLALLRRTFSVTSFRQSHRPPPRASESLPRLGAIGPIVLYTAFARGSGTPAMTSQP